MKTCQCGRDALHCPFCGCGTVYGVASLLRVVDDVEIYSYRCRKCGKVFDDITRTSCTAPNRSAAQTKRITAKVSEAVEGMSYAERKEWVMNKMRGVKTTTGTNAKSVADEIDSPSGNKEEPQ